MSPLLEISTLSGKIIGQSEEQLAVRDNKHNVFLFQILDENEYQEALAQDDEVVSGYEAAVYGNIYNGSLSSYAANFIADGILSCTNLGIRDIVEQWMETSGTKYIQLIETIDEWEFEQRAGLL